MKKRKFTRKGAFKRYITLRGGRDGIPFCYGALQGGRGRAILLHCVTRRVGGVKFPQKVRYVTFECSLNARVQLIYVGSLNDDVTITNT